MAFDEGLAERIRDILRDRSDIEEKKMFGGLAFMAHGNMSVGITGEDLMSRVGADQYEELLEHPQSREMDFTGKALKGFLYIGPEGYAEDDDLAFWVNKSLDFVDTLPAKEKKKN